MSKKFESKYFDTIEELLAAKTAMESDARTRRKRLKIVRQFSNGLATMSEEEARALGYTEITNHLTTFRILSQRKSRLQQTFTTTRTFFEIIVDTDNPEWDRLKGLKMTQVINQGLLYHTGVFRNFIKALAGEIQIAGGAPVMHREKGGWAPKLSTNILLPKGSRLTASELTYAMAPKEYTLAELQALVKSIRGEDGVAVSKKAVTALIEALQKQVKGESVQGFSYTPDQTQHEHVGSAVDKERSNRNATIDAWWFYEVKTSDSGEQHVSGTLFTDKVDLGKENEVGPQVLAYFERAFVSPDDWLHLVCMDMEIGGDVTWDSVRGIAEIMYPSSSEIETLLNLMIQGDKQRAKPRYQLASSASSDDVLAWDDENDAIVPNSLQSFDMKGSSAPLLTPIQMLMGNVAGFGASDVSNTRQGGELRQQAVERQGNNTVMQFGDLADWTCQLEEIATTIVERALTGRLEMGAPGYHEVMWVRSCLEKGGVPFRKLMKKEHGRLKYVRVRVRRTLGDGGRDSERSASEFLMGLYSKIAPQNRPLVLQNAIAVETQDPDLAEALVKIPLPIINAQKLTAENERDTIFHRALLGMPVPTNSDDVHQDHLPIHMMDLVAKLSKHQLRAWDKMDVMEFAGLQRHAQDHLELLLGDKDTNDEGLSFLAQFTEIVKAAQSLVALVEEQEGQAGEAMGGMTEKERAEIELKAMAEHRKGVELGAKLESNLSLEKQRLARQQQVSRQGYVRELETVARLALERQRMAMDERKMLMDAKLEKEKIKEKPKTKSK